MTGTPGGSGPTGSDPGESDPGRQRPRGSVSQSAAAQVRAPAAFLVLEEQRPRSGAGPGRPGPRGGAEAARQEGAPRLAGPPALLSPRFTHVPLILSNRTSLLAPFQK